MTGLPAAEVEARIEAAMEDPALAALVRETIGHVADKWTLLILEALEDVPSLRFSEIGRRVEGISQKMLTKTLRQMECDGLLTRTVHPVIPPHVDYSLTDMGLELGAAFCGVWLWAATYHDRIRQARAAFQAREGDV
ncbi:winged helix-turn-helix transcriptional regulator [Radicibacter daui]|uniref:winged helix-turn-helix transcriptional regulator n=1 Tax=Radicibacter daui TaxID=3064829 RepID=UPI004046A940